MSTETSDKLGFPKLGENNYSSWNTDMKGKLMEKHCWKVTSGSSSRPSDPLEVSDWEDTCDVASGVMFSGLHDAMKELVKDYLGDPKRMWDTLQAHCQQRKPTTRFVAYESLLGIQKLEAESLPALCMRITAAQRTMKDTRPTDFTLESLDNDLACMALIRALPPSEFSSFRSILLLQKDVTLSTLMDACRLEETNRSSVLSSTAAFAVDIT